MKRASDFDKTTKDILKYIKSKVTVANEITSIWQ